MLDRESQFNIISVLLRRNEGVFLRKGLNLTLSLIVKPRARVAGPRGPQRGHFFTARYRIAVFLDTARPRGVQNYREAVPRGEKMTALRTARYQDAGTRFYD